MVFTLNSEINILAAQLAKEQFLVPHVHVLISPTAEAANFNLLQPIRASTVFARKVDAYEWERIIELEEYEILKETVSEEIQPKRFFAELIARKGNVLPLIVYGGKGAEIFHYESELDEGVEVLYLYTKERFLGQEA